MKIMHELLITLLQNFFLQRRRFLHMNYEQNEPFNVLKTFHRRGNEALDVCTIKLLFISQKMLKVVRDAHGSERKIHCMTKAKLNVIFYIQKEMQKVIPWCNGVNGEEMNFDENLSPSIAIYMKNIFLYSQTKLSL